MSQTPPTFKLPRQSGYMPDLDGLRAIAVGAVIIAHLTPSTSWLRNALPWGSLGVHLFFVLSGFLITGILLRARTQSEANGTPRLGVARAFFARRALRIFPVYFATLIAGTALGLPGFREFWLWHATFTTNIRPALGPVDFAATTHFWTLAVEEQFYFVLPWLVLWTPRRAMPWLLGALALAGPVSRGVTKIHVPTIGFLDSLCGGALLAYVSDSAVGSPRVRRAFIRAGLWAGVPLAALFTTPLAHRLGPIEHVLRAAVWAVAFAAIVGRSADGLPAPLAAVMRCEPVAAVGKLSFGIYVFHMVVPHLVPRLCEIVGLAPPAWSYKLIALWLLTTAALAVASWFLLERPLLRMKDRFHYTAPRKAYDAAPPAAPQPPVRQAA